MTNKAIIIIVVIVLLLISLYNSSNYTESFTQRGGLYPSGNLQVLGQACDCGSVADETTCMQCNNCTWLIGTEGNGRCIPYDQFYSNSYWWNPFSWFGNAYWNPYYSPTFDYTPVYSYYPFSFNAVGGGPARSVRAGAPRGRR